MRGTARSKALELLARREHSQRELHTKLRSKGFAGDEIEGAVTELSEQGLQSDDRFLELFVEGRAARGQGPLKIAAELRSRGITGEQVNLVLEPRAERWCDLACTVRDRRFGASLSGDAKQRAAEMRFLAQRGFDGDQIRAALGRERAAHGHEQ